MKRMVWLFLSMLLFGCSDILSPPPSQCDPDRRCTSDSEPVCGGDLQWYECASMADCVGVGILDDGECDDERSVPDDPPDDPPPPPDDPPPPPDDPPPPPDDPPPPPDDPPPPPDKCEPVDYGACQATDGCDVVVDDDGCESCECDDQCARTFCDNYCPQGYVIVDGCPTCECFEPCDRPTCDLDCSTGHQVDPATGCFDGCECLPAEGCSGVACTLFCDNGFRRDASGCEVCQCRGEICATDEDCAVDEHCVHNPWEPFDGPPNGECVQLETCDAEHACSDGGPCGFYFRQDCCPPLTTCTDDLPACPAVCLLDFGDLP